MAKKSKAEVKPEIEPQINETETTPEIQQPVEVIKEESPKTKVSKKSDSPFDSDLWDKNSGISEEQYHFISKLVKNQNPKFCLEVGFGSGSSAYAVLNSTDSIEKYLTIDTKLNTEKADKFSKKYSSFNSKQTSSANVQNFIADEFTIGVDLFLVDLDSNFETILQVLTSNLKWINNGALIIVNGLSSNEIEAACNEFQFKNRQMVQKSVSESGLITFTVNRGLFRAPTS